MKHGINDKDFKTLFYQSLDLGVYNPPMTSTLKARNSIIKASNYKRRLMAGTNTEVPTSSEIDTPEELEKFSIRCKIAIIKSVIFAGYITLAALIGTGAMSLSIPDLGKLIMTNPAGVGIGISVEFMFSFFTRMAQELKIVTTTNGIKK